MALINATSTRLKITSGPQVRCSYSSALRAKSLFSEFPTEGHKLCKQKGKREKRVSTSTRLFCIHGEIESETKHEGVAVFVVKDGRKVLLGRRITSVCNDAFGLPGGHLEFGESFKECAVREVKEETGLDIEKIEFLTTTEDLSARRSNPPIHILCVLVRATLVDPQQVPRNLEPEKCAGWDWYDWDNLPGPLFDPLKTTIQDGFSPFTANSK